MLQVATIAEKQFCFSLAEAHSKMLQTKLLL